MSQLNRFVTEFCRWADERAREGCPVLPRRSRERLPEALRKALLVELPSRDDTVELIARDLLTNRPRLTLCANGRFLFSTPETMWASAATPGWNRGWRDFSSDEHIVQVVSDFIFMAAQYVARSRIADLTGAIALAYRIPLDFRSGGMRSVILSTERLPSAVPNIARILGLQTSPVRGQSKRWERVRAWLGELNCLDPYIHRIVFQYIRSIELDQHGFPEESVTALDGVVDVATAFWRERFKGSGPEYRRGMAAHFMSRADAARLDSLYSVRSYFGAHPGASKWWDFYELYDDELELCHETVVKLIRAVARAERQCPEVDANPASWSQWFATNCFTVWRAVWFAGLPR